MSTLSKLMWVLEMLTPIAAFLVVLNEEFNFLHEHPDDSSMFTSVIVLLLAVICYRIGAIVDLLKTKQGD